MTESRLADSNTEFWQAVHADYLGNTLTVRQILAKHGLTQGEFNHARSELNWTRRYLPQVNRRQIIKRLFRLLDRMLTKLENEMTDAGEKEVAVLGKLIQSMGKLIEMEAATAETVSPRETREMLGIRSKLIARIAELKRN
jgi:hypothetical protein